MDEEKLLAAIAGIAEGLRSDISKLAGRVDAVGASYDQLAGQLRAADAAGSRTHMDRSMRRDQDDRDPVGEQQHAARQTAADARSDSVGRAEFTALASSVTQVREQLQARPMANLAAFEDVQSKADAVLRAHGERAAPQMPGEDIVAYSIRMHRPMQKFSPKWKGVVLGIISADRQALGKCSLKSAPTLYRRAAIRLVFHSSSTASSWKRMRAGTRSAD